MDFQILYTEPALDDSEAILAWSWAHHPGSTERFANSLLNYIELLRTFPYMGAPVKRHPGVPTKGRRSVAGHGGPPLQVTRNLSPATARELQH